MSHRPKFTFKNINLRLSYQINSIWNLSSRIAKHLLVSKIVEKSVVVYPVAHFIWFSLQMSYKGGLLIGLKCVSTQFMSEDILFYGTATLSINFIAWQRQFFLLFFLDFTQNCKVKLSVCLSQTLIWSFVKIFSEIF